ncbi:DUF192 domain-containing protein [Candidatus Parcubacteria bacterium]|nr:DUF192 domain-containing protein [Candidatus Parcubacteria bacterium]
MTNDFDNKTESVSKRGREAVKPSASGFFKLQKICTLFKYFVFCLLVCFAIIYFLIPKHLALAPSQVKNFLTINNTHINIEVADTYAKRVLGLSRRTSLAENTGLLFIWTEPKDVGIWMKDMNFPIDIVWIDASGKIIDIKQAVSPDTFPTVFYPRTPALYVLELNAGFTEKHNIKIGDMVVI